MAKRRRNALTVGIHDGTPPTRRVVSIVVLALLFFMTTCFSASETIKTTTLVLMILTLLAGIVCFPTLRERIRLPFGALALFLFMGGISAVYALSGKFALYEFLKLMAAFCIALLLTLIFPGEGVGPARRIASVVEGSMALASFLSVDLISTQLLAGPVLSFFGLHSTDFADVAGLIPNTRINSIFTNPNVFGGCAALAVLLSLGLALSAQGKKERRAHLCCLYITSTAFVLAFSMGAIASIAVAFVVYLLLEHKEQRSGLFILMIETLILVFCSVMVISVTSFDAWTAIRPIPVLCLIVGAVLLCLADRFVGRKLTDALRGRGKILLICIAAILVLIILFVVVACSWTGPISLAPNQILGRAAYLEPGEYTLASAGSEGIQVTVRSQNQEEAIIGTYNQLYRGNLSQAVFTVPEDSLVVRFYFSAPQAARLEQVQYSGAEGSGSVALNYRLLPDFISNRIQGLRVSQTAVRRLVLFGDGLRLFQRSPIIGLGLGSFQNAVFSVQKVFLETKYVHNHYIQTMLELGVIGLILFVGLLAVSAVAVIRARRRETFHPLTPALGAALAFMAVHGFVEVIFSSYQFLPIAFTVLLLINLCCGDAVPAPWLGKKVRSWIAAVLAVLMIVFGCLLTGNMMARRITDTQSSFPALERSVSLDKYEWADYALSYVMSSISTNVPPEIHAKAAEYAEALSHLDSNVVPLHLAHYYFHHGQIDLAMEMAEKFANYISADTDSWHQLISLLTNYESSDPAFRAGVARIAEILETRNAENMSQVVLVPEAQAFLDRFTDK